jgi:hypothetical protein
MRLVCAAKDAMVLLNKRDVGNSQVCQAFIVWAAQLGAKSVTVAGRRRSVHVPGHHRLLGPPNSKRNCGSGHHIAALLMLLVAPT